MAPLAKQLTILSQPFQRLPPFARFGVAAAVAAGILALAFSAGLGGQDKFQYVFTNLGPEDSTEVAEHLKVAGIPFRLEASGAAVSVASDKVYDARLLLASLGLPRGGGVGFELFDRGDLGVSEFTQRVNFQRAIEGELARTIGHLAEVRSARVHLTLEQKTLFREDEHKASAAVVLNLQPGRTLDERAIGGIRHLVASSVPGLSPEAVTLVDGRGRALTSDSDQGKGESANLERSLEQRLVALLETVAGQGAVVAKVSATVDDAEVTTSSEVYDPDTAALRSEHKVSQNQNQENGAPAGIAGAAGNQPLVGPAPAPATGSRGTSSNEDQLRNYELSKTVTHTVKRSPRLVRLSVAVLVDGVAGKPRPAEEIARFGEIAKKAVGFDAARGDVFEITSAAFARSTAEEPPAAAPVKLGLADKLDRYKWWGAAAAAVLIVGSVFAFRRKTPRGELLLAGSKVSELEEQLSGSRELPSPSVTPALADPAVVLRNRAVDLAQRDPGRAGHLLRAWIASDSEPVKANHV